jgi:nucleoside-diphosphate-sugar epimerase
MAQKVFLVTGATGATGGYAVERLLERGHAVRALAHREDDGSERLQELGAEVVILCVGNQPHALTTVGPNRFLLVDEVLKRVPAVIEAPYRWRDWAAKEDGISA